MQTKTIKIRNIKGRVEDNILSKTGMAVSVSHGMAGISRQMAYTYDAIGRLTGKRRQLTGTGVSTCQYAYDVHGWLRSIREGEFREQLCYADGLDGGCWNGNVSTVKWKTDGNSFWQGYNMRYDGAGRLQSAVFGSGDNLTSYRGYFSESAEYDSGGNVTGLRRRGLTDNLHGGFSYVDRLCMTYEGNRLVSVRDSASRLPYANATDFGGVTGREYALAYNGAGALVSDEGRGMARVDYDLMGNPARIQFTDGSVTRYIYRREAARLPPHGGAEHHRRHGADEGAGAFGDSLRRLHGLPARGQPHNEERAHRQVPLRRGILPGLEIRPQPRQGLLHVLLLRP